MQERGEPYKSDIVCFGRVDVTLQLHIPQLLFGMTPNVRFIFDGRNGKLLEVKLLEEEKHEH